MKTTPPGLPERNAPQGDGVAEILADINNIVAALAGSAQTLSAKHAPELLSTLQTHIARYHEQMGALLRKLENK